MIYGEYIFPATSQADDREATTRGWKEVVRCKDCKWWSDNNTCIEWYDSPYAPADGYCFRAERKEE